MENINGEFIMKGCVSEDPGALHSPSDAVSLIHRIGFLPLFSNSIPGFSIEEHVPAEHWWTGDPEIDPWEWRQILAGEESIAYGKFFNKTAGFISKDFFPTFANYRRNGYDFDALFEDELASYRTRNIMDVFECDDEGVGKALLSSEIWELAGKDEVALTELQMQTYLIISSFRQKKNKKGQYYGWHLAVFETPETKWGRSFVAGSYSENPDESWKKIALRMKENLPEADEKEIRKILGIKYPGQTAIPTKPKRSALQKSAAKAKPVDLPWPENLITQIGLNLVFPKTNVYKPLSPDQMDGLSFLLSRLDEREREAIRLRFEEHKTFQQIGDGFGLSSSRAQQIINKAVSRFRPRLNLRYLLYGYAGAQKKEKDLKKTIEDAKNTNDRTRMLAIMKGIGVWECGLSVRSANCLSRAGINTLGGIIEMMYEDPLNLLKIRNLGRKSLQEVFEKLKEYGVDCAVAKEECFIEMERMDDLSDTDPSVRLLMILFREGIDTREKLKDLVTKNPDHLLRIQGMGKQTREELFTILEKQGVDCAHARALYNSKEERTAEIAVLGLSDRVYNILTRAGLDSLEKVKSLLEDKPFDIFRLGGMGKKARSELFEKLEISGVDCSEAKEKEKVLGW